MKASQQSPPNLIRRCGAEAIATFSLVFAGCGAVVADHVFGGSLGAVGIALVFGLTITGMIYAMGHLSGAHINPAVTISFAVTRHFPAREAVAYISAQFLGAISAAFGLLLLWPEKPADLGVTVPSVGVAPALSYEIVMSAILMFVIISVATDVRAVGAGAAIAIGGTVALDSMFGGSVTGASMNPARSLGPALASGTWTDFWIYLAGPIVGTLVGVGAYQLFRSPHTPPGGQN